MGHPKHPESGLWCGGEGVVAEFAYAAAGAYGEGEREGVPVLVGVGLIEGAGFEGRPVLAVVSGDVGSVGAYGDPGFGLFVIGHRAAIAAGWGLGWLEHVATAREGRRFFAIIRRCIISTYSNNISLHAMLAAGRHFDGCGLFDRAKSYRETEHALGWFSSLERYINSTYVIEIVFAGR